MSSPEKPQFIDRIHAAQLIDCSVQLIDKKIRRGELRAYRFGRKVLLKREELLEHVESNRVHP